MKPTLAIFDLDNTLIDCDSDYLWGVFLIEQHILPKQEFTDKYQYFYDKYQQQQLDTYEYNTFVDACYQKIPVDLVQDLLIAFAKTVIAPKIKPKMQQVLKQHLAKQHLVVVASATSQYIIEVICKQLFNIDNCVGSKIPSVDGNNESCLGSHKITQLKQWLNTNTLDTNLIAHSYFYSDSINDLPLLSLVKYPIVVDPDPKLLLQAKKNQWQVL